MVTLVTGASGFIGRRLIQDGHRALVRHPTGSANEVVGDLTDLPTLERACHGVDTIFHCAGHAHAFSSSDLQMHRDVNFEGTKNLLQAAGLCGVARFVFLSSVKAMAEPGEGCVDEDWPGEPVSSYGYAKRAAEDAVLEAGEKYGMHVVNLRLAMVYGRGGRGNLERMVRGVQAGWFPPLPKTGNKRSLVHVLDVVDAIKLVAERKEANGRTYIVADPQPYSSRQIYDSIRHVLAGGTVPAAPFFCVPSIVLRVGGRLGDSISKLLRRPMPLSSEVVDRLLGSACYCPARIERELGWQTKISLLEGLEEMLADEKVV
jgi:UDP-glucose 4-epimerase